MAEIFGKQLPALDGKKPEQAIRMLEEHVRYLQEQIDYQLGQIRKGGNENGV